MAKFPDLPVAFMEHLKREGKRIMNLEELTKEYKEWEQRKS